MAILTGKWLNLAVKSFDDTDKYIDIEPAEAVVRHAIDDLTNIKNAVADFAMENQNSIRELHAAVTSETGSKQHYRMQNTQFAEESFVDYITKVLTIPTAVRDGTVAEDLSLNSGFFDRDRQFIVALFNTDDNEPVPIPAEEAFDELRYMQELTNFIDAYSKKLTVMASLVPEKTDSMDGEYAKRYETSLMAVRLAATSIVRFCAMMLRHIINNAEKLYAYATDTRPRWARPETPAITTGTGPVSASDEDFEANRWKIFV